MVYYICDRENRNISTCSAGIDFHVPDITKPCPHTRQGFLKCKGSVVSVQNM